LVKESIGKSSKKFKPFKNGHWYPCTMKSTYSLANSIFRFNDGYFSSGEPWANMYKPSELIIGKSLGKINFPEKQ
jgi:hypothetical protein